MARKKDNEIYTYQLKSGKTKFGFKTYIGINQETGKAVKVTRQGFTTRKEAEQAKTKIKADGTAGIIKNRRSNEKTVSQVYYLWLPIYRASVRASTYNRSKANWSKIEKEFGNSFINQIDPTHLQKFADELAAKYVDYRPVLNFMKRIIKYAMLQGWCETDPFNKVIIPKKSKQKHNKTKGKFYERDELIEFLKTAKELSFKYYAFFELLANLGIRRGEAFGLKWSDVDFKKNLVHIRRTVSVDENEHKKIGQTKTFNSVRDLPLSKNLKKVLLDYKDYTRFAAVKSDFLFATHDGQIEYTSVAQHWLDRIYKKDPTLKRISIHGFRHTFASLLYDGGSITPKDVQYSLGHKNVTTALQIYTHMTKQQKQNVKKSINNLNF